MIPHQKTNKGEKSLVIGLNFSGDNDYRLKKTLNLLGINNCLSMFDITQKKEYIGFWERKINNYNHNWDELFYFNEAAVGQPICLYWRELLKIYPRIKFIIVEEEGGIQNDIWAERFKNIYIDNAFKPKFGVSFTHVLFPYKNRLNILFKSIINKIFNNNFNKIDISNIYKQHINDLLKNCPAEKLLKFSFNQGWKPLCEFLNKVEPISILPKEEIDEIESYYSNQNRNGILIALTIFGGIISIGSFLFKNLKRN